MYIIRKILFPSLIVLLLLSFGSKNEEHQVIETTIKQTQDIINYLEKKPNEEILGLVEIPEISLKMPIYKLDSQENNVDKNITILKESVLPPNNSSEVILAAHSGNGPHAYFKTLDKLKEKSIIHFTYQNKKYSYEIIAKKEVLKNGTISLENYENHHIVLITCSKTNDQLQEVYTGILKNQIEIN